MYTLVRCSLDFLYLSLNKKIIRGVQYKDRFNLTHIIYIQYYFYIQLQISFYSKGHQRCQSPMTSNLYSRPKESCFYQTYTFSLQLPCYSNGIAEVQDFFFFKKNYVNSGRNTTQNEVWCTSEQPIVLNVKLEFLDLNYKQYGMNMILNQHC